MSAAARRSISASVACWCAAAALCPAQSVLAPAVAASDETQASAPDAPPADLPKIELIGVTHVAMFNRVDGRRVGGLSGLAHDRGRWLAVSDDKRWPRVFELRVEVDAGSGAVDVRVVGARDLPGSEERTGNVRDYTDAEGVAPDGEGGFFVCFEEPPMVARFAEELRGGARGADEPADAPGPVRNSLGVLRRVAMFVTPERALREFRFNRAFESIALLTAPSGARELWAGFEAALKTDGPEATPASGSLCRVFVFDAASGALLREHVYESLPAPASVPGIRPYNSFSEMTPIGDRTLLTLERRFSVREGYDGTIRLVHAFEGETDVRGVPSLTEAKGAYTPLKVATVASLRALGVKESANFEAMAAGPTLDDPAGGRLLLVLSDDNFGDDGQPVNVAAALRLTLPAGAAR